MRPANCVVGLLALLLLPATIFAKDVAVIVHKDNHVENLPIADLTKFCRGESAKWADGREVVVVMKSATSSPENRIVSEKIYHLPPDQVEPSMARSKTKVRLVTVASDELVIKLVSSLPGAIGFVDVFSITSAVKVVRLEGKLPLEFGYMLKGN